MTGSGRGSSGSASVSPIMISAMPATATMSPGPASSASMRSTRLGDEQFGDLGRSTGAVDPAPGHLLALADACRCRSGSGQPAQEGEASRLVTRPAAGPRGRPWAAGCARAAGRTAASRFSARVRRVGLRLGHAGPPGPGVAGRRPGSRPGASRRRGRRNSSSTSETTSAIRASGRSVLLTTRITGRSAPAPCAARSGSAAAGPRRRRPAAARRRPWTAPRSTSPPKSAWPGVSMTLITVIAPVAGPVHGGVLGQDRDALFLLQVPGVHHPVDLDGAAPRKAPGLPQHGVDQRGLAVVDVGDDGDVAEVVDGDARTSRWAWGQQSSLDPLTGGTHQCGRWSARSGNRAV